MGYRLPMFPLSNVVFPYMLLPLHIFEERYRALMVDLQDEVEPEFGVVLIERGWEVGGGDERADLGTVVRLLDAEEIEGGRWVAVTARGPACSCHQMASRCSLSDSDRRGRQGPGGEQ
jgi:Lon protease-like protein